MADQANDSDRKERKRARKEAKRARKEAEAVAQQQLQNLGGAEDDEEMTALIESAAIIAKEKCDRKERKRARKEAKRARKEAEVLEQQQLHKVDVGGADEDEEMTALIESAAIIAQEKRERKERKRRARKEVKRARKEAKAAAEEGNQAEKQLRKWLKAKRKMGREVEEEEGTSSTIAPVETTKFGGESSTEQKSSTSSSASSSSRSRRSSVASSDGSRTYSSDNSNNEPNKRRTVRSYGPDASSWRMYEKARAEFLQKKLAAGGQLPAHVRDPKLISTLRRPYIPGAGRRSTYGLMRTVNGGTTTTSTSVSALRGARGRIFRGRGRANFRFFPSRPKAEYMDQRGQIDKRKLLEIATENATKLAMEGKLPKGAELVDSIKIKSVEQLATLCKQVAEEEASRPVPFTKWISPDFALSGAGGAPQQQRGGSFGARRMHRPGGRHANDDDDYLLLQKVSSGSEEEGDEEERFQRRHESWKRRTQKAKDAGDEESEGVDNASAFRKPFRLLSSEIKIKIAGSTQKSMSWLQLGKAPPLSPVSLSTVTSDTLSVSVSAETEKSHLAPTHSLSAPLLAAALVRPLPKPPIPPVFPSSSSLLPPPPTPPKLTPPPKPPLLIRSLPKPPKPPVLTPKLNSEPLIDGK